MTQADPVATTFHVDQEHNALRIMLPLLLFGAFIVGYWLITFLLRLIFGGETPDYAVLISCAGAIPIGLGLTILAERGMKQVWRSGRQIVVENGRLQLLRPKEEDQAIDLSQAVNLTKWYFPLKGYPRGGRERHLSANWFCLAGQLQQDEGQIIFFTFMPPDKAAAVSEGHGFHKINPADVYETSVYKRYIGMPERPKLPARVIGGQDGRFWLAERNRWQEGVEMTGADFTQLVEIIDEN